MASRTASHLVNGSATRADTQVVLYPANDPASIRPAGDRGLEQFTIPVVVHTLLRGGILASDHSLHFLFSPTGTLASILGREGVAISAITSVMLGVQPPCRTLSPGHCVTE